MDELFTMLLQASILASSGLLLSLNFSTHPDRMIDRIRLIFTDNVLAQSIEGREFVEFEIPKIKISGMPYIAFFISLSFGISLVIRQMRKNKNY